MPALRPGRNPAPPSSRHHHRQALAVAGAIFQALLRNPLATPHTLGVSAGGALGAVVAISVGLPAVGLGPLTSVQFFALLGALANIGIIYLLARRKETFSPLKLLLAGVTLGLISSAAIMFVRFISDPHKLVMVDRWLMGGLDVQGFRSVAAVLPLFLPAIALLLTQAGAMNQLSLGEEMAAGRGVDVGAVQVECFVAGSVLTAAVVSVAGPIGFVGLIVPHLLRGLFGPDHRTLLFLCFFGGGVFLAVADTIARSAFAPSELPVGVLTAMLGGPFFLILLITRVRDR
ncbi:MAG: FecCD family ABC transporter permease [Planctomycetota bacterium]|jgi:iron complex transport system permease protein